MLWFRISDADYVESDTGATLLMSAQRVRDDPQLVSLLLSLGANADRADMYGMTALAFACMRGRLLSVKILSDVTSLRKDGVPIKFAKFLKDTQKISEYDDSSLFRDVSVSFVAACAAGQREVVLYLLETHIDQVTVETMRWGMMVSKNESIIEKLREDSQWIML